MFIYTGNGSNINEDIFVQRVKYARRDTFALEY